MSDRDELAERGIVADRVEVRVLLRVLAQRRIQLDRLAEVADGVGRAARPAPHSRRGCRAGSRTPDWPRRARGPCRPPPRTGRPRTAGSPGPRSPTRRACRPAPAARLRPGSSSPAPPRTPSASTPASRTRTSRPAPRPPRRRSRTARSPRQTKYSSSASSFSSCSLMIRSPASCPVHALMPNEVMPKWCRTGRHGSRPSVTSSISSRLATR